MLYRRHVKACAAGQKNAAHRRCKCPVWLHQVINGVEIRKSLKTADWAKAQKITEALESGEAEPEIPTMTAAMAAHMRDMAARKVTISTRKKFRQLFDRMTEWGGKQGLIFPSQWNVQAARDFRATWDVKPITANKMLERMRSFFRFCESSGWVAKNPASGVTPATDKGKPTMPFTASELTAIMAAIDKHCEGKGGERLRWAKRFRALVLVLRWSALRISDAVMLKPEQIEGDCIRLYQHKTGEHVRVPVPAEVIEALKEIGAPGGFFFGNQGGKVETRTGDWRRQLRGLFAAANVPDGHAHRFRDTRAVELLTEGLPMDRVAAILGNTERVCAKHYAPWVKARQERLEEDVRRTFKAKVVPMRKRAG